MLELGLLTAMPQTGFKIQNNVMSIMCMRARIYMYSHTSMHVMKKLR